MGKLKGLQSLKALRASLPPGPEKTVLVEGTAIKAGVPTLNGDIYPEDVVAHAFVGVDLARPGTRDQEGYSMGVAVPANGTSDPAMKKLAVMAMLGKALSSSIDEGQIVGELLEWLFNRGLLPVSGRDIVRRIQQDFFEERDK